MIPSKVSGQLMPEEVQVAHDTLNSIRGKIPGLIGLTLVERKRMRKLSERNYAFIHNCLGAAQTNRSILPPTFDLAVFDKQVRLTAALHEYLLSLKQLTAIVQDTLHVVGVETLKAGQEVYAYVKASADRSPALNQVVERLAAGFTREATASSGAPPPPPDDTPALPPVPALEPAPVPGPLAVGNPASPGPAPDKAA